ncbi:hypothetical protein [Cohnella sp. JJ-181]|uniref:hypothetical protein n=1 Tax=Cohnella rhizoplanae TaxID=2974897 RepID=UPI0022FF84D6|nr:hypothetical protein [Cohnella sp. JJ-181]CAI6045772.1 hypothetical protein COHCIP112018_01272 [Cohnella sp. JJ-181]
MAVPKKRTNDVNGKAAEVAAFIDRQRKSATGRRLEMLQRDLSGTIKLFTDILLPVFGTLEGFHLEYEIVSASGVKIYADVYYEPLGIIFECDGFVPHVEMMTRDRFSFERQRVRTFTLGGYLYVPFGWDEMDKRADACKRAVLELLGKYGRAGKGLLDLSTDEREVIRMAADRTFFTQREVRAWLKVREEKTRKLMKRMLANGLIDKVGGGDKRGHGYALSGKGADLLRRR